MKNSETMKNSVIDLFCGAGALTHGFILEDFEVVAGLDVDKSCKYAYETNNPGATFIDKKGSRMSKRQNLNNGILKDM